MAAMAAMEAMEEEEFCPFQSQQLLGAAAIKVEVRFTVMTMEGVTAMVIEFTVAVTAMGRVTIELNKIKIC